MTATRSQLEALSQRLRAAQEQWRPGECEAVVETVATAAGPLRRGRLHEWLGVDECLPGAEQRRGRWTPAMAVLMDAAVRAWREGGGGLVVWIGRKVWPYAMSLPAEVVTQSVLIDSPAMQDRLWAIDLVLRSRAVTAVVADGSGLNLRATRRLQLAAEAGRSLALLARAGHEATQRSAAAYRWKVRALPARTQRGERNRPRWEVELFRSKDAMVRHQASEASEAPEAEMDVTRSHLPACRIVEWHHAQGLVTVPALVVDPASEARGRSA